MSAHAVVFGQALLGKTAAARVASSELAKLTGAVELSAHCFALIARPGDVFTYQNIKYTVDSVCTDPLVFRCAGATLMPRKTDLIRWEAAAS